WEQLGRPARLTPHPIQAELRHRGHLGRKTKQGFYDYSKEPPAPALAVEPHPLRLSDGERLAVSEFVKLAATQPGTEVDHYIFARILTSVLNEAALAFEQGVASRQDIDTAMRLGTNYPRGPLEWAESIGRTRCGKMMDVLNSAAGDA